MLRIFGFSKITTYFTALFGLTVVLLLRRFPGIEHDSVLYLGQLLLYSYPEIFSQDIFFLHGSQDKYTIFPWLIGYASRWVNPLPIFRLGSLIGLLFFIFSSLFLLKKLLPKEKCHVAWIGVLCLPPMYGYVQVFSYSEPFFTARIYAEVLCLFAIGFMVRRCWISAIVCLIVAGLLHPLQILAVLPVIWLWLVVKDRRWLHFLWLVIPVIVLALVGIHPLDGLFEQADPFWLMNMRLSPQLFITLWDANIFTWLIWDIFILILAWRYFSSPFGVWARVALISLLLGIISNLILVDWLHLVLPTGLQLWRIHWLAHWFAMASFSLILLEHWRAKQWSQAILLILMGQLVWCEVNNWSWAGIALVYLGWPKLNLVIRPRLVALLDIIFGLGLVLLFIKQIVFELKFFHDSNTYYLNAYSVDHYILLCLPTIILGLYFFSITLWNQKNKKKCWLLCFMLLPALLWGGLQWDSRSNTRIFIDNLVGQSDIFGFQIPKNAQIYWNIDTPILSWYILNRAHYYSHFQVAGQVFNRATAVEGHDRRLRIKDMNKELKACQDDTLSVEQKQACHISDVALYKACSPSLPLDKYPPPFPAPPDYIVLPLAQPQTPLGQWLDTYYLYSCVGLMEELQIKELPHKEEELPDMIEELSL